MPKGKRGFQAGEQWNGNRSGRPKNKSFREFWSEDEVKELMDEIKRTYKQRPEILKLAAEQIFGKPHQNLNIGGQDEKPIPILITGDKIK